MVDLQMFEIHVVSSRVYRLGARVSDLRHGINRTDA